MWPRLVGGVWSGLIRGGRSGLVGGVRSGLVRTVGRRLSVRRRLLALRRRRLLALLVCRLRVRSEMVRLLALVRPGQGPVLALSGTRRRQRLTWPGPVHGLLTRLARGALLVRGAVLVRAVGWWLLATRLVELLLVRRLLVGRWLVGRLLVGRSVVRRPDARSARVALRVRVGRTVAGVLGVAGRVAALVLG